MRFTYDDLQWFQEDHTRRELLDGELHVDGLPANRAQQTVACLVRAFGPHVVESAGMLITHPLDRALGKSGPDFLVLTDAAAYEQTYPDFTPDLAVEVLQTADPRTETLDSYRQRHVTELWFVDLDRDVIEAYVLDGGTYGDPVVFRRGDTVTATAVPGFSAAFDRLVPPA